MSRIADALHVYGQMKELVATRRPVVFLDFDGTLSDITAHPDSATLVHGADEAVRALAAQCPVAVVSGRDPGRCARTGQQSTECGMRAATAWN